MTLRNGRVGSAGEMEVEGERLDVFDVLVGRLLVNRITWLLSSKTNV